jgi:hypothetical protein
MPELAEEQRAKIDFEAYGVTGLVTASGPELLESVRTLLPPGWKPASGGEPKETIALDQADGAYTVTVGEAPVTRTEDLDVALGVLDAQVRAFVSLHAPERIFIHAGVVAHEGRAIVIPGPSFCGKTTLVAELLRAGATYYSDEYAVLDDQGMVHPYPKPLSVREEGTRDQTDHPVESCGVESGVDPVRIGVMAVATYRPGAEWKPERKTAGEGALSLLANAVPARERPAEALAAVRRAAEGAIVLEGERGEAGDTVADLLAAVRASAPA